MPAPQPDALQVDVDGALPHLVGGLLGVAVVVVHDPGVVEQHVEGAEGLLGAGDHGGHVGIDRHVGAEGDGLAAGGDDLVGHRPGTVQVHVDDGDPGPLCGEQQCALAPDALCAAGDQRCLPRESHR